MTSRRGRRRAGMPAAPDRGRVARQPVVSFARKRRADRLPARPPGQLAKLGVPARPFRQDPARHRLGCARLRAIGSAADGNRRLRAGAARIPHRGRRRQGRRGRPFHGRHRRGALCRPASRTGVAAGPVVLASGLCGARNDADAAEVRAAHARAHRARPRRLWRGARQGSSADAGSCRHPGLRGRGRRRDRAGGAQARDADAAARRQPGAAADAAHAGAHPHRRSRHPP